MRSKPRYCGQLQSHVRIANFCGGIREIAIPQNLRISSWSYDMAGRAKKCVERYCELANKTTQQLHKVSNSMYRWSPLQRGRNKICWRIVKYSSQIVLICLYLARIGPPDILWSVNKLATIHNKMDQSLWQTLESIDFMYSSHEWIQTILSCGQYCKKNADCHGL